MRSTSEEKFSSSPPSFPMAMTTNEGAAESTSASLPPRVVTGSAPAPTSSSLVGSPYMRRNLPSQKRYESSR